jgi:RNA polymerase sigma factor (sigma-70 family)
MDSLSPETRSSLLQRVRDLGDGNAWTEFVRIYSPVIYRSARQVGLQDADAQEVTQQVLWSTAKALEERPHDSSRARFRTWLAKVTRNATLNVLTRKRRDKATGDSEVNVLLHEQSDVRSDAETLEHEYRKEVFRLAAEKIQPLFDDGTWQAFWLTFVEGNSIEEVARRLCKQTGSIYAARSRVIRRFREEVERFDKEWEGE